jgi:hypothetical protein
MQIWSQNSKKCSKAELAFRLVAYAGIVLGIAGARPSNATQPNKIPVTTPIVTSLKSDLASRSTTVFDHLLVRWERLYGTKAVEPLLSIAGDSNNADADRYVALMGAARLGGFSSAPLFVPFLKDSSWMIRSAALRILSALENPQTAQATLPLLKDPALVVRLEAVATVQKLRPVGVVSGLVEMANDEANYHGGKALWVPQKAIEALVSLRASEAMPKLRPLLDRTTDPEFLAKTVDALDTLAGQPAETELETSDRVKRWKVALGNIEPKEADTAVAAKDAADTISAHQAAPRRPTAAGVPAKAKPAASLDEDKP